jgi:hypothetical protein
LTLFRKGTFVCTHLLPNPSWPGTEAPECCRLPGVRVSKKTYWEALHVRKSKSRGRAEEKWHMAIVDC